MTDLSRLIADLCADLDAAGAMPLSTQVETLSTDAIVQVPVSNHNFHSFRSFHSQNCIQANRDREEVDNPNFDPIGSRVTSFCVGDVETAERVERQAKTLAGSTFPPFPLSLDEVERVERESDACERPSLDLNRAAPQRSDWWTGPAMAEVDALAPPAGNPLPITPADVRAGVARELRALAGLGVTGAQAQRRAVEVTAAKIRNSPALAERQVHEGRCHHCGDLLDDTRPVVAVLQARGQLWVHGGECHDALSRRKASLVARILASAGYGLEANGEAA